MATGPKILLQVQVSTSEVFSFLTGLSSLLGPSGFWPSQLRFAVWNVIIIIIIIVIDQDGEMCYII